MLQDIPKHRRELYIKSAEFLELFIQNIPEEQEKVFYSKIIADKIDCFIRDKYLNEIKEKIEEMAKNKQSYSIDIETLLQVQVELQEKRTPN